LLSRRKTVNVPPINVLQQTGLSQRRGTSAELRAAGVGPGAQVLCTDGFSGARVDVLRFEEPLTPIECENYDEEIRRNTRAYNAMLERLILRHPEQWWWMHRRWKSAPKPQR
jgi:hypothetical protein